MTEHTTQPEEIIHAVARIQAGVLAMVCGLLGGVGLMTMTLWLVIKGGEQVGPHLSLLGQYFYGYSVSWSGSLVGFLYGVLVGGFIGWLIGSVYNFVVGLRLRRA